MRNGMMKKKIFLLMALCMCAITGCSVSFSTGEEKKAAATSSMIEAVSDGEIVMEDMTLVLPVGMKCGVQDTDMGKAYYVWATEAEQVSPTDEDIMLYIFEGNDINSPDEELTNQEAKMSIQSYIQIFRETLNVHVNADPDVTENTDWYAFQFTGYSGEYEQTSYGKSCYPKYYYGVYTLERVTDDYNRNFYGFIFSNDSRGEIIDKSKYDFIYSQIKESFSIREFYTQYQLVYDESKDYSNGYSYDQLLDVFAEVQNYHGIQKNKTDYKGTYDFLRVEKDNTITVNDGTTSMNVKLIGVDIPLDVPENDAVDEDTSNAMGPGRQAAEYMEQLLNGKKIYLEYGMAETDENGRILAYLYLDDKETMLNKMLLEKGFARCVSAEPNTKYAGEFSELENAARDNNEGFWSTEVFGHEE